MTKTNNCNLHYRQRVVNKKNWTKKKKIQQQYSDVAKVGSFKFQLKSEINQTCPKLNASSEDSIDKAQELSKALQYTVTICLKTDLKM